MRKIKILDLFCCAGNASDGYKRAFEAAGYVVDITGVDIRLQKHYPYRFILDNALNVSLEGYDFIHASPPCQGYTQARHIQGRVHPMLIAPIRARLQASSVPWIMENVSGAPMGHFIELCGTQFGLKVYRHRQFEASHLLMSPGKCHHPTALLPGYVCVYGGVVRGRQTGNKGNHYERYGVAYGREAVGITREITQAELSEAIPPAYTEYLGAQIAHILMMEMVA